MTKAMQDFQNYVNGFGFGISKEKLVSKAYTALEMIGHKCCLLNERYMIVDGEEFMLSKSQKEQRWIVKQF